MMVPSPVFSLDPGASCDPERVDLGLQPLLGTMVHASQVWWPIVNRTYGIHKNLYI